MPTLALTLLALVATTYAADLVGANNEKTEAAESFYDSHSSRFVYHYGKVIQQCRAAASNDTEEVRLMSLAAHIEPGQRILDNGCGVGGVAAILTSLYSKSLVVDGVTISTTEAQATQQRIRPLCPKCKVFHRDYSTPLPAEQIGQYNRVLFLDTTGYVHGPCDGIAAQAAAALSPGGRVYFKDQCAVSTMSNESITVRKEVWHYQFRTVTNLVRCFESAGLKWIAPPAAAMVGGHDSPPQHIRKRDNMVRCSSSIPHGLPHSDEGDPCDGRVIPSMDTAASNKAWNNVQRAAVGREGVQEGAKRIRLVDKEAEKAGKKAGTYCCALHFEKPRRAVE